MAWINTYSSCDLDIKPGCEGTNGGSGTGYEFEIPFTISPANDTFVIGDTITIESNFGDSLYSYVSNKNYQIGDFDFLISIYFHDQNIDPLIGTWKYDVIPVIGTTTEDSSSFGKQFFMKHEYKNNTHRYKVKIIMKDTGYFHFSPGSFIDEYRLDQLGQHITNCEQERVHLTYFTNGGNGNFYMKKFAKDHNVREWKDSDLFKSGFYFFYIKD